MLEYQTAALLIQSVDTANKIYENAAYSAGTNLKKTIEYKQNNPTSLLPVIQEYIIELDKLFKVKQEALDKAKTTFYTDLELIKSKKVSEPEGKRITENLQAIVARVLGEDKTV